jgi:hypothetical protein
VSYRHLGWEWLGPLWTETEQLGTVGSGRVPGSATNVYKKNTLMFSMVNCTLPFSSCSCALIDLYRRSRQKLNEISLNTVHKVSWAIIGRHDMVYV